MEEAFRSARDFSHQKAEIIDVTITKTDAGTIYINGEYSYFNGEGYSAATFSSVIRPAPLTPLTPLEANVSRPEPPTPIEPVKSSGNSELDDFAARMNQEIHEREVREYNNACWDFYTKNFNDRLNNNLPVGGAMRVIEIDGKPYITGSDGAYAAQQNYIIKLNYHTEVNEVNNQQNGVANVNAFNGLNGSTASGGGGFISIISTIEDYGSIPLDALEMRINGNLKGGNYINGKGKLTPYTTLKNYRPNVSLAKQPNLSKAFTSYRTFGKTVGFFSHGVIFAGVFLDFAEYQIGMINDAEFGYKLSATGLGFIGGPIGLGISSFLILSPPPTHSSGNLHLKNVQDPGIFYGEGGVILIR